MSKIKTTLKHNKHVIHPCPNNKKLKLIEKLINEHENKTIYIISSQKLSLTCNDNIKILNDEELKKEDSTCSLLISYDLPDKVATYIKRMKKASDNAIILLDTNEQTKLYPIETYLKRVIRQEQLEGFECEPAQKVKVARVRKKAEYQFKADEEKKEALEAKRKRDEERGYSDKPKKFEKKFDKKDEKPKKFKPKKVGKKITIKARKPKEN
mgnify:CR=1 FL=1